MNLIFIFSTFASVAAALDALAERQNPPRPRRPATRPTVFTGEPRMQAPQVAPGAPSGFSIGVDRATRERARSGLKPLPDEYVDRLALVRRQLKALDFYECETGGDSPAPTSRDCNVIIDQVYAAPQDFILARGTCVVFDYQTCRGFFCSLCGSLLATSDFIGNQLLTADTLCVSQGRAGTVVGTQPPQWDAGFVRAGASLPTYSVCTS